MTSRPHLWLSAATLLVASVSASVAQDANRSWVDPPSSAAPADETVTYPEAPPSPAKRAAPETNVPETDAEAPPVRAIVRSRPPSLRPRERRRRRSFRAALAARRFRASRQDSGGPRRRQSSRPKRRVPSLAMSAGTSSPLEHSREHPGPNGGCRKLHLHIGGSGRFVKPSTPGSPSRECARSSFLMAGGSKWNPNRTHGRAWIWLSVHIEIVLLV